MVSFSLVAAALAALTDQPPLWRAVHYYAGQSAAHDALHGNASKTGRDADFK